MNLLFIWNGSILIDYGVSKCNARFERIKAISFYHVKIGQKLGIRAATRVKREIEGKETGACLILHYLFGISIEVTRGVPLL